MKCKNCGYVSSSDFQFCKNCGTPAPENVLADCPTPKVLSCVKSNLFLVFCILLTASAAITSVNILALATVSGILSIPKNIIILLLAIASWLIYFDGRNNQLSAKHLKFFSIGVLLKYIWGFLGGAAIIFLSAISILFPFIATFFQSIEYGVPYNLNEFLEHDGIIPIILFMVIGGLIFLVGVISIIINITGRRPIYRFSKSIYKSVETENEQYSSLKTVPFWLIAFAVIQIGADFVMFLANPTTIFATLQKALYYAALVIGAILVQNYFKKDNT